MKNTLVLAALVSSVCQLGVAVRAPRTPAELVAVAESLFDGNDAVCQKTVLSCNNCTHLTQCVFVGGLWKHVQTEACEESTPYCERGACVQQPEDPDECASPTVSDVFQCFDGYDGYFPSPDNCAKFYVCQDGVAYVYNCPEGHVYWHERAMCAREDEHPEACYVFPCAPDRLSYQLYRPDPTVYAACVPNKGVFVTRCPTPKHRIDPEDPYTACMPYCSERGRVPDEKNPRKYYDCDLVAANATAPACRRCSQPGTLADPVAHYCPPGAVFSDQAQRCVRDDQSASPPWSYHADEKMP